MTPQHARQIQTMTYAEYLAHEEATGMKHEFINGEVFAMTGGTIQHSALASRITTALSNALAGRPCQVFTSDGRVRIVVDNVSTYPDISVVCGSLVTAPDDSEAIINPVVLVEVLSDWTEGYDRGKKFERYRRLPSLQAYVLVTQTDPQIEVYQRQGARWALTEAHAGDSVTIDTLGVTLDVDAMYANPLPESE
jgi:Uma2 family endonuclease